MEQDLKEKTVHGNKDYPFALYCIYTPKHQISVSSHWHDEIEIIHVKSGELNVSIGKDTFIGRQGDVFIVNSQEIHGMSFENMDTKYLTALFPPSFLSFMNIDNPTKEYLMPLQDQKIGFIHEIPDSPVRDEISKDLDQIVSLNKEKPEAYQLGTKSLLLHIVYLLFANGLTFKYPQKSDDAILNRNILSYIKENFTEDISLHKVASQFLFSDKYFSRYFKHAFKITFVEYVNRLRIEYAADLLTDTDMSVTEIALQCGYSGSSYFNKVFKSMMGVTPGEYRS